MPKQILKNTANELAVKLVNNGTSTTITLADGTHNTIVPAGYAVLGLHWTQIGGTSTRIVIERSSGSGDILTYSLSGNGSFKLDSGLADSVNAITHPTFIVSQSGAANYEYTIILHLSKIHS